MGVTTIVVAGDRRASHPVFGVNKALLPVAGRALVAHVVRTLADVPDIARVIIVGPVDRLAAALADVARPAAQERRVVPQGSTLYDNVWRGFLASLTDDPTPDVAALKRRFPDAVVAVVASDLPLVTAGEVGGFLRGADMAAQDYVLGITPIEALAPFAPQVDHTGVRMAALNLAEGGFRQNNLHIMRPFRIAHTPYIEEFYEARYQKDWWNVVRLIAAIARKHEGTLRAVGHVARMQASMRAQRRGWDRLAARARRGVSLADVCSTVSRLLGTRFAVLECPAAGAVLDIDNEHDLATISTHFGEWRRRLLADADAR